jgi:hypothetical protein
MTNLLLKHDESVLEIKLDKLMAFYDVVFATPSSSCDDEVFICPHHERLTVFENKCVLTYTPQNIYGVYSVNKYLNIDSKLELNCDYIYNPETKELLFGVKEDVVDYVCNYCGCEYLDEYKNCKNCGGNVIRVK